MIFRVRASVPRYRFDVTMEKCDSWIIVDFCAFSGSEHLYQDIELMLQWRSVTGAIMIDLCYRV